MDGLVAQGQRGQDEGKGGWLVGRRMSVDEWVGAWICGGLSIVCVAR